MFAPKLITTGRWIARVAGTLLAMLFLVFFVGEGLSADDPAALLRLSPIEYLQFAAVGVMLIGAILAWWRELAGGALCIAGGLLFVAVESWADGQLSLVWFPIAFALIGAAFAAVSRLSPRPANRP